jgi:hypothetical protein
MKPKCSECGVYDRLDEPCFTSDNGAHVSHTIVQVPSSPLEETWRVEDPLDGGVSLDGRPSEFTEEIVQTDSGVYLRDIRDMYLIAAAPEMYRALARLVAVTEEKTIGGPLELRALVNPEIEAGRAALRKARGE